MGYAPSPAEKFAVEVPDVLAIGNDERLLKRLDGTWYSAGWAYSIIESFVSGLWQAEMREPGSYTKRIKTYRDAVNDAPQILLEKAKVAVDCTVTFADKHKTKWVADMRNNPAAVSTANGFEIIPTKDFVVESHGSTKGMHQLDHSAGSSGGWPINPCYSSELRSSHLFPGGSPCVVEEMALG